MYPNTIQIYIYKHTFISSCVDDTSDEGLPVNRSMCVFSSYSAAKVFFIYLFFTQNFENLISARWFLRVSHDYHHIPLFAEETSFSKN